MARSAQEPRGDGPPIARAQQRLADQNAVEPARASAATSAADSTPDSAIFNTPPGT